MGPWFYFATALIETIDDFFAVSETSNGERLMDFGAPYLAAGTMEDDASLNASTEIRGL